MKNSLRVISRYLILVSLAALMACSRTPIGATPQVPDQGVLISTAQIIKECTNPHKVYIIPPQPIPGIPMMLVRHAECLGHTNILLAWWSGPNSRVNFLYADMLVERHIQFLRDNNEHFKQKLLLVEKAVIDGGEKQSMPESHMAVYKLEHISQKEQK